MAFAKKDSEEPPPYEQQEGSAPALEHAADEKQRPTHYGTLNLQGSSTSELPSPDSCLAHLRLLAAFEKLKSGVGLRDGLWDIWDDRAESSAAGARADVVVKLREKRWAIYLARAVDRFEAWYGSFVPSLLRESDMVTKSAAADARYEGFVESKPISWTADILPPLDVLLVWHTYMLNPRIYLEDCLRHDHGSLWASGIPWELINSAIGPDLRYQVSESCKEQWHVRTGRAWDNLHDPAEMEMLCGRCASSIKIPWTTCGQPPRYRGDLPPPGLIGHGYGDGKLSHVCEGCKYVLNQDVLRVIKFQRDAQTLIADNIAMPGTILDRKTGRPMTVSASDDRLFPSRVIKQASWTEISDRIEAGGAGEGVSMFAVRNVIQDFLLLKGNGKGAKELMRTATLTGRAQVRKMMSRYWENSSMAGIDLISAVMRQGEFVQKMGKIDWLHSPASRATMERSLVKYTRFLSIIASKPTEPVVPTLDIDLAWHTHQLSPQSYYKYTVAHVKSFVDHDDKIDTDKLSLGFQQTCKIYLEKYLEPYSECTCWYCVTVRVTNTSRKTNLFTSSRPSKAIDAWHASGAAAQAPQPPYSESAHISAHNSIKSNETVMQRKRMALLRAMHDSDLKVNFAKAQSMKEKSAKTASSATSFQLGPAGRDKTEFWGKEVVMKSPADSAAFLTTTSSMYAVPVGTVEVGMGAAGNCAQGSCLGDEGCASGAVSMCYQLPPKGPRTSVGGYGMAACGGGGGGGCGGGS